MANVEPVSDKAALRKQYGRSRISNGSQLLPLCDHRSMTARRFRDLYNDICADLGGINHLSEGQKQLVRRVAQLSAEGERMEALSARGEKELDLQAYGRLTNIIGITLTRLGIARQLNQVSHRPQDLRSYLASVEHQHPEGEAAE